MRNPFAMEQQYRTINRKMHLDAKVLSNVRKGYHFLKDTSRIISRYMPMIAFKKFHIDLDYDFKNRKWFSIQVMEVKLIALR